MKTLNLIQGTPEWAAHRATHYNASDAPAMMGCSPYKTRTQLLHEKHTGLTPDVDPATQRRFDDGHRFEALARPLAEKIIGETLYPITGSEGKLSASFDGLTMDYSVAFEHKTLSEVLRYTPWDEGNGEHLPMMYRAQMEQQLMVSGAERVLFMASKWQDDVLVEKRHCWYASNPELRRSILQGWTQFAIDLAAYTPPEITTPVMAAPQLNLPAVSIQVNGSIALVDNLDKFGTALNSYIAGLNREPETDQDFANLEDAVKRLKAAEEALDAAEAGALGQTESIDTMRRTVALHRETARSTRLLIDRLVKTEKENRRNKIISDAVADLHVHITGLTKRVGNYPFGVVNKFADVIKGLKSIDSMRDKVATELARCKIESNASADRVEANLKTDGLKEYGFLFSDTAHIANKAPEDFRAIVATRIAAHKAAEAAKEEATRERIRAEEQAKAEREAREKLAREKAEEATAAIAADAKAKASVAEMTFQPGAAKWLSSLTMEDMCAEDDADVVDAEVPKGYTAPAVLNVVIPLKTESSNLIRLGQINERLSPISITVDGLAQLGFTPAATDKSAKLYKESDLPSIYGALIHHIHAAWDGAKQAA